MPSIIKGSVCQEKTNGGQVRQKKAVEKMVSNWVWLKITFGDKLCRVLWQLQVPVILGERGIFYRVFIILGLGNTGEFGRVQTKN